MQGSSLQFDFFSWSRRTWIPWEAGGNRMCVFERVVGCADVNPISFQARWANADSLKLKRERPGRNPQPISLLKTTCFHHPCSYTATNGSERDRSCLPRKEPDVNETTQTYSKLQAVSVNNAEKKRLPKVTFAFTPIPDELDLGPALEKLYRILMRWARRGVVDPSLRRLGAAMKRSVRMVQRYIRELVRLGWLAVEERRIARERNATNVYILKQLGRGVGDKNVVEKKGEVLNTTTAGARPARGLEPKPEDRSWLRRFWESRFAHDRAESKRMREQFEAKGAWMLEKARERTRAASRACDGIWRGQVEEMSDDEKRAINVYRREKLGMGPLYEVA